MANSNKLSSALKGAPDRTKSAPIKRQGNQPGTKYAQNPGTKTSK